MEKEIGEYSVKLTIPVTRSQERELMNLSASTDIGWANPAPLGFQCALQRASATRNAQI